MRTEFFIAQKILKKDKGDKRLSRPVVFISTLSIVLGVAIMISTVSIVKGFQGAIKEKVVGFGAHIQIAESGTNFSMESSPLLLNQEFVDRIKNYPEVANIQAYAYKPGVLQSTQDSIKFSMGDKDTLTKSKDILGVLFKGVDTNYDWDFIRENMISGEIPNYAETDNQILISERIANQMGYGINSEIDSYFIINSQPKKRKFIVSGIYNTGLEEFDKQLIFCNLSNLQEANNWGIQSFLLLEDTCFNDQFVVRARIKGGNKNYQYDWGNGFILKDYYLFDGKISQTIELVAGDFETEIYGMSNTPNFLPDTARIIFKVDSACSCSEEMLKQLIQDDNGVAITPFGQYQIINGKGNSHLYGGGFEVILNDYSLLAELDARIHDEIPFELKTETIEERHADIFSWLKFLDMNINIVIVLILAVSLINMITSLLVLILEKTNMIGVLKAIGATNKNIRIIFLYHSFHLLGKGLFWGNLLGVGFILLQHFTGFLTLNPEVYFLNQVPVSLNVWYLILINLITIIICRGVLILPSLLITRIRPVKAIKFD